MLLWLVNAALWAFVFAPLRWNIFDWASDRIDGLRRFNLRGYRWALVAFALILALGYSFRFDRLDTIPPQLFSDLVENIQDAYRIYHEDNYRIYMDNNNGREPLHYYLLSILASQPGQHFDFYALKLTSALESFLTLPLMFWLGIEVIGPRRRQLGLVLGLLAMGLVAVSFWHVMMGRQGLRISLTPLFTALTCIFFVRALRGNQRSDYVKAGLALGFGLLSYQAMRMLPAAIVISVVFALVIRRFSWRMRASYLLNLAVLAFVSLMVFLPLFQYWIEEPESYLRRSATRIFGDMPTTEEERAQFLLESGAAFLNNTRKTLLMFNYTNDRTWVSATSGEPAMDTVSGAFLILGAAAWLLLAKSRDPVHFFIPMALLFALLASALALSFPGEVPSLTRSSGGIPPAYLIAALPLAVFCLRLRAILPRYLGTVVAIVCTVAALLAAYQYNRHVYFDKFNNAYTQSAHSYTQAGTALRGFAESDGAYGNAYIIAWPHWWDHRAVGIEGGLMFWENAALLANLPLLLRDAAQRSGDFRLQPERDLLFFYAPHDDEALPQLREWFPQGKPLMLEVEPSDRSFFIYRVPALGEAGLANFIESNS